MSYHKTCKQFLIAFTTFFASWLSVYTCVCVYVGLPNNKITYWNFKFLLVNYLKLSIPCTQSLPACEKLLKRKPIDYVHFTVCESGPQTHRYLGRVYLDYFEEKIRQELSLTYMESLEKNLDDITKMLLNTMFVYCTSIMLNHRQPPNILLIHYSGFGSRIIYLIYIQLEVWCQMKCNEVFIIPPCIF